MKFNLIEHDAVLHLYFFTVQGGMTTVEIAEDVKAVMAYNDAGAIEQLRKEYPAGTVISARVRAKLDVKRIVDALNLPDDFSAVPMPVTLPPSSPPKEKTAKDFVFGMMLVADSFVSDADDREALKRIISKIDYGNEASTEAP